MALHTPYFTFFTVLASGFSLACSHHVDTLTSSGLTTVTGDETTTGHEERFQTSSSSSHPDEEHHSLSEKERKLLHEFYDEVHHSKSGYPPMKKFDKHKMFGEHHGRYHHRPYVGHHHEPHFGVGYEYHKRHHHRHHPDFPQHASNFHQHKMKKMYQKHQMMKKYHKLLHKLEEMDTANNRHGHGSHRERPEDSRLDEPEMHRNLHGEATRMHRNQQHGETTSEHGVHNNRRRPSGNTALSKLGGALHSTMERLERKFPMKTAVLRAKMRKRKPMNGSLITHSSLFLTGIAVITGTNVKVRLDYN